MMFLENEMISIIMPTYNVGKYIGETIESIINQTFVNWELLITDDCSTDDTVSIIKKYQSADNRIKLDVLDENAGAGAARNNSIEKAKGRYIAFCDSDDWWYPYKLDIQYNFIVNNGYEFIFSAFEYCNSVLEVTSVSWKRHRLDKRILLKECSVGTPGVLYDTKRIGKIYFPLIRKRQDWGMWLNIIDKTKYAYSINWPLWKYRLRNDSLSRNKKKLIKYNIEIYNKLLGFSMFKSCMYFYGGYMPMYFLRKIREYIDGRKYLKSYKINK